MDVIRAADASSAAQQAADFIARRVRNAVRRRGRFTVAVSGGSTPAPMFAALARRDLPWGAFHVYQVDERVAPDGDDARNARQLDVFPVPLENRHLMEVTWPDVRVAIASYAAGLPDRFDVVHLGLGDDGHTASWPPGDHVVDLHVPVARVEEFNGHPRMTLTPMVVNAARRRLVLVTGAGKAEILHRWLQGDPSLPAHRIKSTGTTVFTEIVQ